VSAPTVTWDDTGRTPGKSYRYRVQACNAGGCSDYSPYSDVTWVLAAPSKPSASVSGTTVTVSWTTVDDATSYRVYRYDNEAGGPYTVSAPTVTWDDTGRTPGSSYRYRVVACTSSGCSDYSPYSDSAVLAPSAPAKPGVSVAGTTVTVSWDAVDGATSYQVRRYGDSAGGPYNVSAPTTSYDDTGDAGATYYYRVTACNDGGCSAESPNSDDAVIAPSTPAAPSVTASAVPRSSGDPWGAMVDVSWSAVSGATSYEVSQNGGSPVTVHAPAVTYKDTGLTSGASYTYTVQACNAGGCSSASPASPSAVPPSLYEATVLRDSPSLYFRWAETTPAVDGRYQTAVNTANPSGTKAVYKVAVVSPGCCTAVVGHASGALHRDNDAHSFYNYLWGTPTYTYHGATINPSNSSYTLELWAKPTTNQAALNGDMTMFSCGTGASGNKMIQIQRISDTHGSIPKAIWAATGYTLGSSNYIYGGEVTAGTWTHIVLTYNYSTTTAKVYLDGTLSNTMTVDAYNGGACTPVWGSRVSPGVFWEKAFSDRIAETAYYPGTVLTATQVKDHYCAGRPTASGC